MPDRRNPPPIKAISDIRLPAIRQLTLSNGISLYHIPPGEEEVIRLDILMDAGRPREKSPLAARATGALLKEGTRSFSGAEVAEKLDFYGASLSVPFQMDGIHLVVYTLTKHAPAILPVVASILLEPTFPEQELDSFRERYALQMDIELQKADVVAYREFTRSLYGSDHPYGYNSTADMYRSIERDTILDHYEAYFHSGNCRMVLSGGASDEIVELIDQTLCQPMPKGKTHPPAWREVRAPASGRFQQALEPSVQTAIRLGCRAPTRHHPDYPGLFVLNTILGGYFGSRLMANIREEKGFTYNIYSSLDSMRFDAYMYIGTEVGHDYVEATKREIGYELESLRKKQVAGEELQMVKNYIMGSFLTLLDGPFQTADLIKGLLIEDVPLAAFSGWVEAIRDTTPENLQRLAGAYLDPDKMWEVIVGKTA